jgi:hypothetical protein
VNVQISCTGGENGFNQAIELSAGALANVKFVQVIYCSPGQLQLSASALQHAHSTAAGWHGNLIGYHNLAGEAPNQQVL